MYLQLSRLGFIVFFDTLLFLLPVELAMIMDRLYGGVCYAGIDTDPELKYPKGAGRVAFSNQQSYIAAISARFVQLQHGDIDKRVSMISLAWRSVLNRLAEEEVWLGLEVPRGLPDYMSPGLRRRCCFE